MGRTIVQPSECGRARAWLGKMVGTKGVVVGVARRRTTGDAESSATVAHSLPVHSSCPDLAPARERRAPA
jgi:hypothetical protein